MPLLTHASLEAAFHAAELAWTGAKHARWTREHLFRVDPFGYPQAGTHLTAFATALFAELAHATSPMESDVARVAYRGIPLCQQSPLHGLLRARIPSLQLEVREAMSLDFALVRRAHSEVPFTVGLAMESEMKPISGPGLDPDALVPDLVKLCLLHTGPKVYLCRTNGGNEATASGKEPKLKRILRTIQNTLDACANLPTVGTSTEVAAIVLETARNPPWRVFTIVLELRTSRDTSYESFSLSELARPD